MNNAYSEPHFGHGYIQLVYCYNDEHGNNPDEILQSITWLVFTDTLNNQSSSLQTISVMAFTIRVNDD